jgi:hypothetical protein
LSACGRDVCYDAVTEIGESNRVITQALRLKQEEYNELKVKYDHLVREARERDHVVNDQGDAEDMTGARPGGPDDIDNVRLNEGRGRFYVHANSVGGGSQLPIKSRKPLFRVWLEKKGLNTFLKMAQQTPKFRDLVVEKLSAVYGLLMVSLACSPFSFHLVVGSIPVLAKGPVRGLGYIARTYTCFPLFSYDLFCCAFCYFVRWRKKRSSS